MRIGTRAPLAEAVAIARSGPVVRRACAYAGIVGTVLIAINHGDALLRGDLDRARLVRMLLTVAVPYAVSTLSSVQALLAERAEGRAVVDRAP